MTTHLVTTDSRSWAAVEETLAGYLPGLGVTLVNLDARRALLDGAVLKALRLQYGPRGAAAVLVLAGIKKHSAVEQRAVQGLLDKRPLQADRPEPWSRRPKPGRCWVALNNSTGGCCASARSIPAGRLMRRWASAAHSRGWRWRRG